MVQHLGIEDVLGSAALEDVGNLRKGHAVQTDHGLDRDTAIVVRANDARFVLVDLAWSVDRVVNDVVEEPILADSAIDGLVVDEVTSRGIDQRSVGLHGSKQIIGNNWLITCHVERNRIALLEKDLGRLHHFGAILRR